MDKFREKSAFIFHLNHAYLAIKSGVCNNVLILYTEALKSLIGEKFFK